MKRTMALFAMIALGVTLLLVIPAKSQQTETSARAVRFVDNTHKELPVRQPMTPERISEIMSSLTQQREQRVVQDSSSLDSVIAERMAHYHIPGLAASIALGDEIAWTGSYGYANIDQGIEVGDTTVFVLASVSKTFVATALLQLWEDGLFELDDDINDYLPFAVNHPVYSEPITFRMLMTHTSAITDNWDVILPLVVVGDSPIALGEFLEQYLTPGGEYYSQQDNFGGWPPGTIRQYSNVGASLAGYLVEAIMGVGFDQYCEDSIFTPLDMYETSWFLAGLNVDNIAVPYDWNGSSYEPFEHCGGPTYPAATLRTSVLQLTNHLMMYMNAGEYGEFRLLDSSTVDSAVTVQFGDYGLLWYRVHLGDGRLVWGHAGGWEGVSTLMFYDPIQNLGVTVLTNADPYPPPDSTGYGVNSIFEDLFDVGDDSDQDSVIAIYDNCPESPNSDQADNDEDGVGDVCDNCPSDHNPDQVDTDGDGIGDVCDWLCGDADASEGVDIDDVVYLIAYIFSGGPAPDPLESGDADCSGGVDIDDVVWLIGYIFSGGNAPCDTDGDGEPDC